LDLVGATPRCTNTDCLYATEGFPIVNGQPVLIDFERSIISRSDLAGSYKPRDVSGSNFSTRVWRFIFGANPVAPVKSRAMLELAKRNADYPVILVIGGGEIGAGADTLYSDPEVQIVGTDVYASANTQVLADGHHLPFKSGVFDGVWIQAVLEHVLNPQTVADETYRTLKPGGYVYADTPFMQQVHEGAYDFTRFTQNGHRWLFKSFEQIDAGTVAGPAVALLFSIRYFIRAIGFPDKIATLAVLPFFWLRFLDRFARSRRSVDGASSTFFFGRKSEVQLAPREIIKYYNDQLVQH
jgi:SAM-dependent methyltransferase